MKLLIGFVSVLFISGCNALDGQLNVTKPFNLKNFQGENKVLEVGSYSATLDQKKLTKKIVLTLSDNRERFEFAIPKNTSIPSNGTFSFKASDIGQNVNLDGQVDTVVTNGDLKNEWQTCTYQQPYTVCTSGPNGQQICTTQMRTVYGNQWVKYYDKYINQKVLMNITPVNSEKAAEFLGEADGVQRVVVSQTDCR